MPDAARLNPAAKGAFAITAAFAVFTAASIATDENAAIILSLLGNLPLVYGVLLLRRASLQRSRVPLGPALARQIVLEPFSVARLV